MASRHASKAGRRGVASWIVVAIVGALLLAGAAVAYFVIVRSDDSAQGTCTSQVQLQVIAAPGAAASIDAAASAFNQTAPVARSACVTTVVTTLPDAQAQLALADQWHQAAGPAPAIWVPETEAALRTLESTDSAMTAGRDTNPIATSPVVIAARDADAASLQSAGLSWQTLPAATGPAGTVALPSGQHLVLALPDPSTNRASSYALQSVLANKPGGTVDAASVTANAAELAAIGAAGPAVQPDTTEQALNQLADRAGGFTAVPVVASDLATFTATTPGLTAVTPTGNPVGDTVYAVPLSASWVTPAMEDAAALFLAYLRGPDGQATFTEHGLQVAGDRSPGADSSGTAPGPSASGAGSAPAAVPDSGGVIPDAGVEVAAAIAAAIGAGSAG